MRTDLFLKQIVLNGVVGEAYNLADGNFRNASYPVSAASVVFVIAVSAAAAPSAAVSAVTVVAAPTVPAVI